MHFNTLAQVAASTFPKHFSSFCVFVFPASSVSLFSFPLSSLPSLPRPPLCLLGPRSPTVGPSSPFFLLRPVGLLFPYFADAVFFSPTDFLCLLPPRRRLVLGAFWAATAFQISQRTTLAFLSSSVTQLSLFLTLRPDRSHHLSDMLCTEHSLTHTITHNSTHACTHAGA